MKRDIRISRFKRDIDSGSFKGYLDIGSFKGDIGINGFKGDIDTGSFKGDIDIEVDVDIDVEVGDPSKGSVKAGYTQRLHSSSFLVVTSFLIRGLFNTTRKETT